MSYKTPREIDAMREAVQQNIQATRSYVKEQRVKAQEPTDYLFAVINQHAKQAVKLYPEPEEPVTCVAPRPAQKNDAFGFWDGVAIGIALAGTICLIGAVIGALLLP